MRELTVRPRHSLLAAERVKRFKEADMIWQGAAAVLALTMIVAAPARAQEVPQRGGTIRLAIGPDPATKDCHGATSVLSLVYAAPHYSNLLRYDPENYPKVVGDIVDAWSMAPDGLTYSFKLHPDIAFHDGSRLTSADVKATYQRLRDPPQGVISTRKAEFADIIAIETPDAQTIIFKLAKPNSGMLATFASPWNCIYSAAKLAEDPTFPSKTVMGSGPFVFEDYTPGSKWTGKRFDKYFKAPLPYLDSFTLFVMSQVAIPTAIAGNQLDSMFGILAPAEADKVKSGKPDFVFQKSSMTGSNVATFNTRRKPFDDARVRRALSLAIDRWNGIVPLSKVSFLSGVGGVTRPGFELSTSADDLATLPGFYRDLAASRAEAKRLLAEAGVPNLKFKFLSTDANIYTTLAVFLIDQWRQIGVTAEIDQVDSATFFTRVRNGEFEVANDFSVQPADEPTPFLSKYVTGAANNYSGASDPALDALFEQQKRTLDIGERRKLIAAFESRLLNEAYVVPLFWSGRIVGLPPNLRGWNITPSHWLNQDLATLWWAK
jgi:peptide/nickel transport system substrate-binding protein